MTHDMKSDLAERLRGAAALLREAGHPAAADAVDEALDLLRDNGRGGKSR